MPLYPKLPFLLLPQSLYFAFKKEVNKYMVSSSVTIQKLYSVVIVFTILGTIIMHCHNTIIILSSDILFFNSIFPYHELLILADIFSFL